MRQDITPEVFAKYLSSERVQVIVGPEEKVFKLQKNILAWASPMMHCAFNGSFKESKTKTLILKEVTVRSFELAIATIFQIDKRFAKFHVKDFANEADLISAMIELSALGQVLIMPSLEKIAASSIRTLLLNDNKSLSEQHISEAFESLTEKSET